MELSQIEKFNVTYKLSHALVEWERSSDSKVLVGIGSRVVGLISTPITGIIDGLAHLVIAAMKLVTGVFISPYNFLARCFDERYTAPADLELSSACVHLFLAFKSVIFIPIVSITSGFCPELASQNADSRIIFGSGPRSFALNLGFSL